MMNLDPRAKLALTLGVLLGLVLTGNLTVLIVACAFLGLIVAALDLTRGWSRVLRVLLPMTAFFVVVTLWSFDLATAVAGALRLAAMATTCFVFFQMTAPEDLGNALVASGVPYSFAFILTTSMQFVPVLSRKMQEVVDAQRSRGIRLERDLASLANYPSLFAPLLIQSFALADELAEAMEARGFGAPHRTFAKEYALRGLDWMVMALAIIPVLVGWYAR